VSGGVAVDDIGGSPDEGGTEVGVGGEDDVGIGEEVDGGNSDKVGDDIGGEDAAVVVLPVEAEDGLEKKSTMTLDGINTRRCWSTYGSEPADPDGGPLVDDDADGTGPTVAVGDVVGDVDGESATVDDIVKANK
jgi:hypothetical protein